MATSGLAEKESENYKRVSVLLVDICAKVLRDVLSHQLPTSNFLNVLQYQRAHVCRLLNKSQQQIVYPPSGIYNGAYQDFDISLLYILLRNFGNIPAHKKKWGFEPDPTDSSLAANIERIRIFKNEKYSHLTCASLDESEFKTTWNTLAGAVKDIETHLGNGYHYSQEVTKLYTISLDDDVCSSFLEQIKCLQKQELDTAEDVSGIKDSVKRIDQNVEHQKQLTEQQQTTLKRVELVLDLTRTEFKETKKCMEDSVNTLENVDKSVSKLLTNANEVLEDLAFTSAKLKSTEENIESQINTLQNKEKKVMNLNGNQVEGGCTRELLLNKKIPYNFQKDDGLDAANSVPLMKSPKTNLCIENTKVEMEEHRNNNYSVNIRAIEEGKRRLENDGVVIYTGIQGSGKSTVSLELLCRVQDERTDDFVFLHLVNPDDWDQYVDTSEKSVVFMDDPIGGTNANERVKNDQGLFKKIFACIRSGNVKVVMSVRSSIIEQNRCYLDRYEIFDTKHTIELSKGVFSPSYEEKKAIFLYYCGKMKINVGLSKVDDRLGDKEISQQTVDDICKMNPETGFPLCCKQFFSKRNYLELGKAFFRQPSDILLTELKNMAFSKDKTEKKQFVFLVYLMCQRCSFMATEEDVEKLNKMAYEFDLEETSLFSWQNVIHELEKQYVVATDIGSDLQYTFQHETYLEAVFITFVGLFPKRINQLIGDCNFGLLYELLRTDIYKKAEKEVVLKVKRSNYKHLANRFIEEIEINARSVALHQAMQDTEFAVIFIELLEKCGKMNKVTSEDCGLSFFHLCCLYDSAILIEVLVKKMKLSDEILHLGFTIAAAFENLPTLKVMLNSISKRKLKEIFLMACKDGKTKIVEFITTEQDKNLRNIMVDGFHKACKNNRLSVIEITLRAMKKYSTDSLAEGLKYSVQFSSNECVDLVLKYSKQLTCAQISESFLIACKEEKLEIIKTFLKRRTDIPDEILSAGITASSSNDVAICIINERHDLSKEYIEECFVELAQQPGISIKLKRTNASMPSAFYQVHSFTSNEEGERKFRSILSCSSSEAHPFINEDFTSKKKVIFNNKCEFKELTDTLTTNLRKQRDIKPLLARKPNILDKIISNDENILDYPDVFETAKKLICERDKLSSHQIITAFLVSCRVGNVPFIRCFLDNRRDVLTVCEVSRGLQLAKHFSNHDAVETFEKLCSDMELQFKVSIPPKENCSSIPGDLDKVVKALVSGEEVSNHRAIDAAFKYACTNCSDDVVQEILTGCKRLSMDCIRDGLRNAFRMKKYGIIQRIIQFSDHLPENETIKGIIQLLRCGMDDDVKFIIKHKKDLTLFAIEQILMEACGLCNIKIIQAILMERHDLKPKHVVLVLEAALELKSDLLLTTIINSRKNVFDQDVFRNIFLQVCSYGRHELLCRILTDVNHIQPEVIAEGFLITCKADNVNKVRHFLDICNIQTNVLSKGLLEATTCIGYSTLELIVTKGPQIHVDDIGKAMLPLCERGKEKHVEVILKHRKDIKLNTIVSGFLKACKCWNHCTTEVILKERQDLLPVHLAQGLTIAQKFGSPRTVSIILSFLDKH